MTNASRSYPVLLPALFLVTLLTSTTKADRGARRTAPPIYHAIDLGTLGGQFSEALALNAHGIVVGDSELTADYNTPTHAFVWEDLNSNGQADPGEIVDLGTLGGENSSAVAINSRDQIVGVAETASTYRDGTYIPHAALWQRRSGGGWSITDLGGLNGLGSRAVGINDAGEIAGVAQTGWAVGVPVTWVNGVIQQVTARNGHLASVLAIGEDGTLAGYTDTRNGPRAAAVKNGMLQALDLPGLNFRVFRSTAIAIDSRGRILTNARGLGGGSWVAIQDVTGLGAYRPRPIVFRSKGDRQGLGANDGGQVVGFEQFNDGNLFGFYWDPQTGPLALDYMLDESADPGTDIVGANAILDDGRIAATGFLDAPYYTQERGFLLVPAP